MLKHYFTFDPFDSETRMGLGNSMSTAPNPDRWRPDAYDGLVVAMFTLSLVMLLSLIVRMFM